MMPVRPREMKEKKVTNEVKLLRVKDFSAILYSVRHLFVSMAAENASSVARGLRLF